MSDPDVIYLQPEYCADEGVGRLWCEDDAPINCEDGKPWVRYIRDDLPLYAAPLSDTAKQDRIMELADEYAKHAASWMSQNPQYEADARAALEREVRKHD